MPWWLCCQVHDLWEPALIWPKGSDHGQVPSPSYQPGQDYLNDVWRWEGIPEALKSPLLQGISPDALLSERARLKYWGTLGVYLLAHRSTTIVPHCLDNLWLARSPKLHSSAFLPLDRASAQRLSTHLKYSGYFITPFL